MDDRRRDYNENEQDYFGRRFVSNEKMDENRRATSENTQRQDRRNSPFSLPNNSNISNNGYSTQNVNQNTNNFGYQKVSSQPLNNASYQPQVLPINNSNYQHQSYDAPMQNGYQRPPQNNYGNPQMQYIPPQSKPYEDNFDYDYNAQYAQQGINDEQVRKKKGIFSSFRNKREEDSHDIQNVIITYPKTFTDVQVIIDSLRGRQAIIVDLTKIIEKNSQRILDYLSGAIYALGGSQQRIGDSMFLFTPDGVSIQGPTDLKNKYD